MTAATYLALVAAFGALCGALVARIISAEAENSLGAFFFGIYTGAGGGLLGGPPFAFLLSLMTGSWGYESGVAIIRRPSRQPASPSCMERLEARPAGASLASSTPC